MRIYNYLYCPLPLYAGSAIVRTMQDVLGSVPVTLKKLCHFSGFEAVKTEFFTGLELTGVTTPSAYCRMESSLRISKGPDHN